MFKCPYMQPVYFHGKLIFYNIGRRKALEQKHQPKPTVITTGEDTNAECKMPCWIEAQQQVIALKVSPAHKHNTSSSEALIPNSHFTAGPDASRTRPSVDIILPLSSDHLITLLQYNVLRATIANHELLADLLGSRSNSGCSSEELHVLPTPKCLQVVPPSLYPTLLQQTLPHEEWVDAIPHPVWRDNILRAIGTFDEDEVWSDTIGGLFEGFPHSEVEHRGIIAWWPPWHVSGWELSEGFYRKWGWLLRGCDDILEATNQWRRSRGEEPLVIDAEKE